MIGNNALSKYWTILIKSLHKPIRIGNVNQEMIRLNFYSYMYGRNMIISQNMDKRPLTYIHQSTQ